MHKHGFTLIELLTVITIMGILIVVGYPSYQSNLRESRRQEAIQELLSIQVDVEKYIAKYRNLPSSSGTYNATTNPFPAHNSKNNLYTITYSIIDSTALTYSIIATANIGPQTSDVAGATSCSTLTLNSTVDGITPLACK